MAIALLDSDCGFRLRLLLQFQDFGLLMFGQFLDTLRPLEFLQRKAAHDCALISFTLGLICDNKDEIISKRPEAATISSFRSNIRPTISGIARRSSSNF